MRGLSDCSAVHVLFPEGHREGPAAGRLTGALYGGARRATATPTVIDQHAQLFALRWAFLSSSYFDTQRGIGDIVAGMGRTNTTLSYAATIRPRKFSEAGLAARTEPEAGVTRFR